MAKPCYKIMPIALFDTFVEDNSIQHKVGAPSSHQHFYKVYTVSEIKEQFAIITTKYTVKTGQDFKMIP